MVSPGVPRCPLVSPRPSTGTGRSSALTSPLVLLLLGTPTTYSVMDESPECPHGDIEGGMGTPPAPGGHRETPDATRGHEGTEVDGTPVLA